MSLSLRVPPFAEEEKGLWVMQVAGNWQIDGGAGEFWGNQEELRREPKMLHLTGDKNPKLQGEKFFSGKATECLISNSI